jgi:hypothetical protein
MTWDEIAKMGSELLNAMDAEQKSILNDTQVFFTDNE